MNRLHVVMLAAALATSSACTSDPYDVKTWIKGLGSSDKAEQEVALTKIEQLGNPAAIPAVGKRWQEAGKNSRELGILIDLAKPLTGPEAKTLHLTDYVKEGRKASWDLALPFLREAATDIDEANPRSIDSAVKAADALGDAGLDDAQAVLVELSAKKLGAKAQRVKLSAIMGLGKYKNAKTLSALSGIVKTAMDDYASAKQDGARAQDESSRRNASEKQRDALALGAAAINGMATLSDPNAVPVLIEAMFRLDPLFSQVRRALIASGNSVAGEMRKILRGEHAAVNALAATYKFDKYCGDDGLAPECKPVGLREFYASVILGDLFDTEATNDLLALLKKPPMPIYYQGGMASPNTTYNGAFDALRKIGSPSAAATFKDMWSGGSDPNLRSMAVGAYGFVARDESALAALGAIAEDNGANDTLRLEAATAYARLATKAESIALFTRQAKKYADASAEKRAAATKAKPAYDKAKAAVDDVTKRHEEAKAKALVAAKDSNVSKDEFAKLEASVQKLSEELEDTRAAFKEASPEYMAYDRAANDYTNFERGFLSHIARVEVVINCAGKAECYAAAVKTKPDDLVARLGKYIPNVQSWTPEQKKGLVAASSERALLELGKMGQGATAQTDLVLDAAKSEDRLIRQSALLALPKIAARPCANCEAKLEEAVKAGQGKSTLAQLNIETQVLASYFAWAGKK